MSGSYVCGFNLVKSEHHEINLVVVLFVKSGRHKQEKKTKTTTCSCLFFCLEEKRRRPQRFESPLIRSEGGCSTN